MKGEIFVGGGGGAVQIKDADGRVVHCDLDSMDLGLLSTLKSEAAMLFGQILTLFLCASLPCPA